MLKTRANKIVMFVCCFLLETAVLHGKQVDAFRCKTRATDVKIELALDISLLFSRYNSELRNKYDLSLIVENLFRLFLLDEQYWTHFVKKMSFEEKFLSELKQCENFLDPLTIKKVYEKEMFFYYAEKISPEDHYRNKKPYNFELHQVLPFKENRVYIVNVSNEKKILKQFSISEANVDFIKNKVAYEQIITRFNNSFLKK